MSDLAAGILGLAVIALAGLGVLALWGRFREWLEEQPRFRKDKDAEPVGCVHTWEPWSEPKEVDVKQDKTTFGSYGVGASTTASEFVGMFQERVCSECNIYERRWA